MNAKQFFILVMQMREAQKTFIRTSSQSAKRECRYLESQIDAEIKRVKEARPDDREINPQEPTHPTFNLE